MPDRREFLKAAGASSIALSANPALLAKERPEKAGEKPLNIILLFTDQHRLSALGAYGDTVCKTPHLDRLARAGVRFEKAYTSCPLCSPARASIMTGQHIHTHGVGANVYNFGCNVCELPDGPDLLSRRLEAAGYACGYSGKWHLGTAPKNREKKIPPQYGMPSTRGFVGQDFPGHGGGGFNYPEYKAYLKQIGARHRVKPHTTDGVKIRNYGVLEGPVEASVPYFLASNTMALIDTFVEQDQPFFIWHNNWGPHEPYYVPEEYYHLYKDIEIPPWPNYTWRPENPYGPDQVKRHPAVDTLPWEAWQESIRHYYAFTTLIDDQIGRMLDHLEAKGIAENTVVIFSSDHGETLGSHGGLTDKGWCHYEEIQRIGLIVRDPRLPEAERGKVRHELTSLLDIYPTILDYAGAACEEKKLHGASLRPLIAGKSVLWRESVFVEFFGLGGLATNMITCRHGDLKYGWTCSNKDELYNLAADPHEMHNLIDDPAWQAEAQLMRRRIYTFMKETHYPSQNMYLQSRLAYSTERQYVHGPDPQAKNDLLCDLKWR